MALVDDAFEGDAGSGSAPGGEDDIGVGGGDGFGCGGASGRAEEFSAGCFYQLGDPMLGVDERLAPFFAVDALSRQCSGSGADGFDGGLHLRDEGFGLRGGIGDGANEADVVVDVHEGVGREEQDGDAGLEDGGEGFLAVGDGGEDEIGADGEKLFGLGGPGVMDDGEVAFGERGNDFEAVFCAGAELVKATEAVESDGDAGLKGE